MTSSQTVVNEFLCSLALLLELVGSVFWPSRFPCLREDVVRTLIRRKFLLLELRQPWWEELEVLPAQIQSARHSSNGTISHICICFGARGILGAFSVFDGPARIVSLK